MKYRVENYVRKDGVKVIMVLTHYAGKTVRGIAKCNPADEFNMERGEELAKARCNYEVAKKRAKNANQKRLWAEMQRDKANLLCDKMQDYETAALKEVSDCEKALKKIVKSF